MTRAEIVSACVAVFCFFATSIGQRVVRRDGAAVVALDQAFAAGIPAAALIRNSIAEGQVQMANGETGTVRITTEGSRKIRYELALPSRQLTSVVNQGRGYRLLGNQKKDFPSWSIAYQSVEHIPILSRIQDYAKRNVQLIDLGLKTYAGRQCRELRLSVRPDDEKLDRVEDLISELHVFIDVKTSEVIGTRGFIFSPDAIENRSPVDRVFSDYRLVEGIPIPFRVDQYVSGKPDSVTIWTSVRLNVGIPNNLFD